MNMTCKYDEVKVAIENQSMKKDGYDKCRFMKKDKSKVTGSNS